MAALQIQILAVLTVEALSIKVEIRSSGALTAPAAMMHQGAQICLKMFNLSHRYDSDNCDIHLV